MRHDEITPPSATISPSKSLMATNPDNSPPSRAPYRADESNPSAPESPAPRSFALGNPTAEPKSATPGMPTLPSIPNQVSPEGIANRASANIGSVVPNGPSTSSIPNSYDATYPKPSSAALPVQADVADSEMPLPNQMSQPARYTNPYVDAAGGATQSPSSAAVAVTPQTAPAATNDSVYARTPYNSFAAKNAQTTTTGASPLRPLAEPSKNSTTVNPADPAAVAGMAVSTSEATITQPNSNEAAAPNAVPPMTSMPATGGYAPGSIRTAQALPELHVNLPASELPSNLVQPTAAPVAAPSVPTSTGSTGIGGGGSFQLGK
jgi:hypothetical protein